MKKCLTGILCIAMLLTGCASKSSLMHPFQDEKIAEEFNVTKPVRLESFSQGQIFLRENSYYPNEGVTAKQALLFKLDGETNPVILCKNAYQEFQPGMITRLLAATLIAGKSDIYDKLSVSADILQTNTELPVSGFVKDDSIRVKDMLYAATMYSKCDIMQIAAEYYSGSVSDFNTDLKNYLVDIGCLQSVINNIFGSSVNGQHINIYDLYVALPQILANEDIKNMLMTDRYTCEYSNGELPQVMYMKNELPYFSEEGYRTASGLTILGGMCEHYIDEASMMLVLAQAPDSSVYVAYVANCGSYEETKQQMEIILGKILK